MGSEGEVACAQCWACDLGETTTPVVHIVRPEESFLNFCRHLSAPSHASLTSGEVFAVADPVGGAPSFLELAAPIQPGRSVQAGATSCTNSGDAASTVKRIAASAQAGSLLEHESALPASSVAEVPSVPSLEFRDHDELLHWVTQLRVEGEAAASSVAAAQDNPIMRERKAKRTTPETQDAWLS